MKYMVPGMSMAQRESRKLGLHKKDSGYLSKHGQNSGGERRVKSYRSRCFPNHHSVI